ncbi:hypothetical protein EDB85DRAFT_2289811 [Lactarius pseudohatsudake]|nr:hypothetical protein EDB85DRAFT_2289811 [Lactarius pseudohatsudake]
MANDAPNVATYFYQYKLTVYDNLFVGTVYGVYIVLYITSVHVLLSKSGFTLSRPRMFMLGTTTFMFVLGIIALVLLALETSLGFQQMQLFLDPTAGNVWSSYRTNVIIAVGATITRLMYILSDVICAWRAVVLWNRDIRIIAILLLFILGTTAAAGCDLGLSLVPLFSPTHHTVEDESNVKSGERALIMIDSTLGTNLVSTGLIAWKAWQHRISVRKHLFDGSRSVRVERVFVLLIESGFLYCCLWILYSISAFRVMPEPGFTVMDAVLLFAAGLYPTLIVILVAMQKSPVEYYSTCSTGPGMRFTVGPTLGPPWAGDVPRREYTIHRKYASDSDTHVPSMVFIKTFDEEKNP